MSRLVHISWEDTIKQHARVVVSENIILVRCMSLTFEWRGGEYIDISHRRDMRTLNDYEHGRPEKMVNNGVVDCINVWDHAEGKPLVAFTAEAVLNTIIDWCEDTNGGEWIWREYGGNTIQRPVTLDSFLAAGFTLERDSVRRHNRR